MRFELSQACLDPCFALGPFLDPSQGAADIGLVAAELAGDFRQAGRPMPENSFLFYFNELRGQ